MSIFLELPALPPPITVPQARNLLVTAWPEMIERVNEGHLALSR
jgi:hypothetical protein